MAGAEAAVAAQQAVVDAEAELAVAKAELAAAKKPGSTAASSPTAYEQPQAVGAGSHGQSRRARRGGAGRRPEGHHRQRPR